MDSVFKMRSYIDQYARLIGATAHTKDNHNFLLKLPDGSKYDVLIKDQDNIVWYNSPSFIESFGSVSAFLQRLLGNYRIASLLAIGPVLRGYHIIDNKVLILIVDHLPHVMNYDILGDNHEAISTWLDRIHNVGVYHGNLNVSNLRMNENNELRMVNFDTMFYRDEKDLPIVAEWINESDTQNIEQFIKVKTK